MIGHNSRSKMCPAKLFPATEVEQEDQDVGDEGGVRGNDGEDGNDTIEAGGSQEGAELDDSMVNIEDLLGYSDEELF